MPQILFSCPENILSQPKTATGHFCSSCSKNVVDFRNYSAEEIKAYFQNRPEKSCGIFTENQVSNPASTRISGIFRIAFAMVFFLGLSATDLVAQQTADSTLITAQTKSFIEISGQVSDEYEPLPFVKIIAYSNGQMITCAISDFEGNYTLKVPEICAHADLEISFLSIGFEELRIRLNPDNQKTIFLPAKILLQRALIVGIWIDTQNQVIIPSDPYDFGKTTITGEDLKNRQH